MMKGRYRYREDILARLAEFAVFPRPHTDPVIVRDYLKALYTMEIRTMRVEQELAERRGDTSGRKAYAERVIILRDHYDILSVPVQWWVERED